MTKFSVLDLIEQLNGIVNSNPEIDFSEVGVSLNSGEYTCYNAGLTSFYNILGTETPVHFVNLD